MKNLLKITLGCIITGAIVVSCDAIPSYNNPPEPGQTEFRGPGNSNNNNPPEPGQTEFKSENSNGNNPPEPGQTEMEN